MQTPFGHINNKKGTHSLYMYYIHTMQCLHSIWIARYQSFWEYIGNQFYKKQAKFGKKMQLKIFFHQKWVFVIKKFRMEHGLFKYNTKIWPKRFFLNFIYIFFPFLAYIIYCACSFTYFFQNLGKIPQHSSMPLRAFSAICISALMESIPVSIFSSCSVEFRQRFYYLDLLK